MTVLSIDGLRACALDARDALRTGSMSDARLQVERLLDLLPEPSDAQQGSVPKPPAAAALNAAIAALEDHGIEDPAVVMLVQENRPQGRSPRSLVSNAANPVDLLRVTVDNLKAQGLWR